mmetsp:Transcript_16172/g.27461  ORF Transcript_16172/g.27461 Transcript_16172/m.27461 type:complete len:239 (-) Transcript_16172:673-1389(-)
MGHQDPVAVRYSSLHDCLCQVHEVGHHWTPRVPWRFRQLAEESSQRPSQALQARGLCHWLPKVLGLDGLDVATGLGRGTQQGPPLLPLGGEGPGPRGAQLRVAAPLPVAQGHEVCLHVDVGLHLEVHLLFAQHLQGIGPLQKGQLAGQKLAQLGQENRPRGGLRYHPHAGHGSLEWKALGCLLLVRLFCRVERGNLAHADLSGAPCSLATCAWPCRLVVWCNHYAAGCYAGPGDICGG